MKHNEEQLTRDREEAWVGDAVLALFVREWILREDGMLDGERLVYLDNGKLEKIEKFKNGF